MNTFSAVVIVPFSSRIISSLLLRLLARATSSPFKVSMAMHVSGVMPVSSLATPGMFRFAP